MLFATSSDDFEAAFFAAGFALVFATDLEAGFDAVALFGFAAGFAVDFVASFFGAATCFGAAGSSAEPSFKALLYSSLNAPNMPWALPICLPVA